MSKMASIVCVIGLVIISMLLIGCAESKTETVTNTIEVNDESLKAEIEKFVTGGTLEGSKLFNTGVEIINEDIILEFTTEDMYIAEQSLYVKIKTDETYYMFRFQLNAENVITSYIKYRIEA